MKAKILIWQEKGKHSIYQTDGNAVAKIYALQHNTGEAYFEVFKDYNGWTCIFWHGNQGHNVGSRLKTKEAAQEAAQNYLDELVAGLVDHQQNDMA